jgi:hypothetical protein
MENKRMIILELRLTRNKALFLLTAFFLCWHPRFLGSEILTMTTYYPAPYGGYARLLTTGQTILARNSGAVGIGTANPDPGVQLEVRNTLGLGGKIRLSGGPAVGLEFNESGIRIGNPGGGDMSFYTRNTERINIDASGNVTIGANNANDKALVISQGTLSITGNGNQTGFISGVCVETPYTEGAVTPCPAGYPRLIAGYGDPDPDVGPCKLPQGKLFTGAVGGDLDNGANWVAYYAQGCTGTMLCCRIKDDGL